MRNSYGRRVIKPRGTLRKLKDYGGVIHDFDRMPSKVEEYGTPAAIFSESGTVSNLFWRGSEEGVHVGSRTKFSGRERRKPYKRIHVEFEGLYCDEFGEDGFTIDTLGKATIRRCGFRGRSDKGANGDRPGEDKFGQIDGGWLVLDGDPVDERVFERCVRALRGKANSVLDIRRADFTRCREAIKGDGDDNPKKGNPFFNGRAGPCLVWIGTVSYTHLTLPTRS